jgi:methionine synthase II (cobalamin-independent)
VLKVNAGSYSFEGANPRHEHEYHLFESTKLPDGKVLCPGVITHASNIVEHPELIAERILHRARERHGRGRLRVLLASLVQDRGASHGRMGEVQGHASGS